jgi:hypothetical protein
MEEVHRGIGVIIGTGRIVGSDNGVYNGHRPQHQASTQKKGVMNITDEKVVVTSECSPRDQTLILRSASAEKRERTCNVTAGHRDHCEVVEGF